MASRTKLRDLLRQTVSRVLYPRSDSLAHAVPAVCVAARGYATSKLFVGGLSFATDESSLKEAFSSHGEIIDVRIIIDRDTGRSKGFGFVTFTSSEDAEAALSGMDGKIVDGRAIRVDHATERPRGAGGMGGGFQNQSGFGSGYSSMGRSRPFQGGFGRTQGGSFDGSFPGGFGDSGFGSTQGSSSQSSTGFSQQGFEFPGGSGNSERDNGPSEDSPGFSEQVGGGQSSKLQGSNTKADDDESWDKFFASLSSKKKDTDSSPAKEDGPGIDNDTFSTEKQVNNP